MYAILQHTTHSGSLVTQDILCRQFTSSTEQRYLLQRIRVNSRSNLNGITIENSSFMIKFKQQLVKKKSKFHTNQRLHKTFHTLEISQQCQISLQHCRAHIFVRAPTNPIQKKRKKGKKGDDNPCILAAYMNHYEKRSAIGYLESLKYRTKMIATTRTKTTQPIIHLFLFILLDMLVKIFLLLPTLSSTP